MNIMNVDYSTKIPNNVNLSEDRQVLKALEGWHPGYMDWWSDMGPGRLPAIAGLSAHGLFGRSARLGQVRLCENAGLSLGHPAGAAGRKPRHSVRRELRQAGLAGKCRASIARRCAG